MKKEQEQMIDRFGLVQAYQNAPSKEDFLYMLMNLEAVQARSGMMAYIRQMLQTIREYARHRAFAIAKGLVLSIFPGRGKETAKEAERFEETPEFAQQMDGLWRALGIDYEAYSDQEVIRQHDELSDVLEAQGYEKEALRRMEYDAKTHVFSVPEILEAEDRREGSVGWRSFAVLSKAEYGRLLTYAGDKEKERLGEDGEQLIKVLDTELLSGDIIVNAESDIVRMFLAERETIDPDEAHPESEDVEQEEPDESGPEQEQRSIDSFAEWLDRINASRDKCAVQGFSHTAAAAALFFEEHGLEKKDGRWVQIVTTRTGEVQEKPLTKEFINTIDRDRQARLLNTAYRSEAIEKDERERKQEQQLQPEPEVSVNRTRNVIDR